MRKKNRIKIEKAVIRKKKNNRKLTVVNECLTPKSAEP